MASGSCSLSEADLRVQLERYRTIGAGGEIERTSDASIVVLVGRGVPDELIELVVRTERSCCPFFELDWAPAERRLRVAVSQTQDVPALDAIASALISD
jgi:hypothetical protein